MFKERMFIMKWIGSENKKTIADVLLAAAIVLLVLGVAYCVHATLGQVNVTILGRSVPGVFLGGFAAFLGGKYLFSAMKLRKKIRGAI